MVNAREWTNQLRGLLRSDTRCRDGQPRLWSSLDEFSPSWSVRIERMASFIDRPGRVVDFGCGPMWVERLLGPDNTYVPLDCIRRDERTVVLDLNTDRIPPLH